MNGLAKMFLCHLLYNYMYCLRKGRRQNSLAAAPIFSSKLQPTYIGKAILAVNAAAFWVQTAVMNVDVFPKNFA